MKRIIILMTAVVFAVQCYAQDIEVVQFKQLETDLTAKTDGTAVLDQNGEKCALIKVTASNSDFSFDAGMIGIVKTIPKDGGIWLYVPEGVKRLTISHAGMETLRDYDLGISVKKACTYLLELKTSKDVVLQTVTFKVSPANASVVLESADNNPDFPMQAIALADGAAALKIPVGKYRYIAAITGYDVESGTFELTASEGKDILIRMTSPDDAPVAAASVEDETITVKGVTFKMIGVQGGTFKMGSASGQLNESPVHEVTLSSYRICETEVTQQLWEAVMGKNPSKFNTDPQNPVEMVSLKECREFISKLNSLTGREFRLPTEAEWEFAARGGNRSKGEYPYSGSYDIGDVAWYANNSQGSKKLTTHPVKTKSPNELGIYDMSGNVWEWCNDIYGKYPEESVTDPTGMVFGTLYIIRGGCFGNFAHNCRVSNRNGGDTPIPSFPNYRSDGLGLRLAL